MIPPRFDQALLRASIVAISVDAEKEAGAGLRLNSPCLDQRLAYARAGEIDHNHGDSSNDDLRGGIASRARSISASRVWKARFNAARSSASGFKCKKGGETAFASAFLNQCTRSLMCRKQFVITNAPAWHRDRRRLANRDSGKGREPVVGAVGPRD